MNLLHSLEWFNRERIVLFIGSLALALGAIFPWYRLPNSALETFGTNLSFTNAAQFLTALLALFGFVTFWFNPRRAPRLPVWTALIAVLLFPYFVTTWSPTVAFLAAAYYDQEQGVSHHIELNFPQVQAQWKQNISLEQSRPVASISNFLIEDSRFFQMSSWDKFLVEGLGYSNDFFGFIGRGWAFTVVGLTISLLALYLGLEDQQFDGFLNDMGKFLPWAGLLLGILVFSSIWSNVVNRQLDTMFAKGEYHRVVATSKTLASWYPPLSGDTAFLQRLAAAGFYGNEPDLGLLQFAQGLERYASEDFLKAEYYFQRSLDMQPSRFLVRGYLATAILNQGVTDFNDHDKPHDASNHKPGSAADRFEQVLQIFPGHIEALYDLMLARVVNGEFDQSASVAQQLIQTQQYVQQPNLDLLGQAYLHLAWASYRNSDIPLAWQQYRQSVGGSIQKKSTEAQK